MISLIHKNQLPHDHDTAAITDRQKNTKTKVEHRDKRQQVERGIGGKMKRTFSQRKQSNDREMRETKCQERCESNDQAGRKWREGETER